MTEKKGKFCASSTAVNFLLHFALYRHPNTHQQKADHEDCLVVRQFSFPFWKLQNKEM